MPHILAKELKFANKNKDLQKKPQQRKAMILQYIFHGHSYEFMCNPAFILCSSQV